MASKRRSSSSEKKSASGKKRKADSSPKQNPQEETELVHDLEEEVDLYDEEEDELDDSAAASSKLTNKVAAPRKERSRSRKRDGDSDCTFVGNPVPADEAKQRWPNRYLNKKLKKTESSTSTGDDELMQAKSHYLQAEVDGHLYSLHDDAYVKAEDNQPDYICKIIEMFVGIDGEPYFRAQWFYRACDTKIERGFDTTENKRLFLSEMKDDNPLDCLISKLKIIKVKANIDKTAKLASIPDCDYYYDMMYLLPYCTFVNAPSDNHADVAGSDSLSTISTESDTDAAGTGTKIDDDEVCQAKGSKQLELSLLDLYAGCGAMSTGLCLGANLYGVNLVTKWAVDFNKYACESLQLNHPETEVRNESVGDFLMLLKEWEKLCISFNLVKGSVSAKSIFSSASEDTIDAQNENDGEQEDETLSDSADDGEEFEVEKILGICYGDPKEINKPALYLKVRWRGYGPEEDTWEPIDGLGDCEDAIKEFVVNGYNARILPLPGSVDVICGGPPCQGISGYNRFRNSESPLDDPKNLQMKVYMDVVDYLKPRYVLMENVVDLLKFSGGFLGKYALGRLVDMNYQARMGMMAAGSYGLPQFRMRVFAWGALPTEKLPPYPLPTHDVVFKGVIPVDFDSCTVAYNEGKEGLLENKLYIGDAISDLPPVKNDESRDEIPYGVPPKTEFQRFIRLRKDAVLGDSKGGPESLLSVLYDHRPLNLNKDDYQRVCRIPKKKGANFRDLPGVKVVNNKVEWDPQVKRVYLPSGKPLVPEYAMTFVKGTSSKPFGRLWYDETVPTVVTRAEPHNQRILHPQQDRVLTIRENARLQGFPDYYQLKGPIKQRYMQVGNAVAVPVARALGYALGMASQGSCGDDPLITLPTKFPNIEREFSATIEENVSDSR